MKHKFFGNQYEYKAKSLKYAWFYYVAFLLILAIGYGHKVADVKHPLISPIAKVYASNFTTSINTQDIRSYIKTIFGKDAQTACAIAHAESGYNPKAKLEWTLEDSNGIFQINLKNKWGKVQYDRVPGATLQEKEQWLWNPQNNTLVAYWIFKTSGWNPWTGYTSGNYLNYMEDCK
ncbi:MAG: transglycosylase SLT domain-containing protein [Patescibacteria group bacterium]|nr:transglycosylase SLT domain-containing protein [Patescibacteria group bacterium]